MMELIKQLKIAVILLLIMTILTGFIYPSLVTVVAQYFFPWQANGSLLQIENKMIGSQLIGQYFNDPAYFWGRPSATPLFPYNALNSSGSNLALSNPDFLALLKERIKIYKKADTDNQAPIPIDLITASGSGLDPEISIKAAYYQINRIAKARGYRDEDIKNLIDILSVRKSYHLFGKSRVNVLQLNLALENLSIQGNKNGFNEKKS